MRQQALHHSVKLIPGITAACFVLQQHSLRNLLANLNDRVQTGKGILEDHSDLIAANLVELLFGDLQQITTIINDLTGFGDGVGCLNAQDCLRGNRFTRAGLTDNCQSLALFKIEIDSANCLNLTITGAEGDAQIIYF